MYSIFARPIRWLWRVSSEGKENIPEEGCIIICNHTSFADVLVLEVAQKRQVFFMGKKELFKIPVLAQLIRALGAYPIDRSGGNTGTIKATIQMLQNGDSVCIFPQGTRCRGRTISETPLKPGAAMISLRAGVPIVPVRIKMKGERYRPFRKNELIIGKPITLEELAYDPALPGEYARVTEIIRARIAELE